MASVTIVMSADDARLMAAHERLFAQQQKALDNYAKNVAKAKESQAQAEADAATRKKAAEEEKERQATIEKGQKLIDSQRSAQEKYNDELAEAKRLYDAGAIGAGDLAKRMNVLKKELRDATGETDKHKEAMARGEAVTRATRTSLEKYAAKIMELKELHKSGAIDVTTFARAQKQAADELGSGASAFSGIATSIAGMATAYLSINTVAGIYNGLLEEQNRLQQTALEKSKEVAAAQSDALKNLAGMSFVQQADLIGSAAEKIAKATGFANRPQLIQSVAAGVSAGATPEESQAAVAAAAKINKTTPTQLATTASAAVDIGRASGLADAERNLGFLLQTGAVSRVEGMDKLANSIAKTIGNVAATTPNVDKETATREAAAAFAVLNLRANDKITGESTATAMVQMAAYMRKFFTEGGGQTDVSEQIAKLEQKKAVTEKEAFQVKQAEEKVAKTTGPEKEKAQVQLNALKARVSLDPIDEKKLTDLKKQQAIFDNTKSQDPGTLSGRMKILQENEDLRKAFLDKMPGEATFKIPMELLVTKGSEAFQEFKDNFAKITYDSTAFKDLEKTLVTASPQLALADASASSESNVTGYDLSSENAAIAEIKKIRDETLPRVRAQGIAGWRQFIEENVTMPMAGYDTSVQSSAGVTRRLLQGSREQLEGDKRPKAEEDRQFIDRQIAILDAIVSRMQSFAEAGKDMKDAAGSLQGAARNMTQQPSIAPAARAQAAGARQ